MRLGALLPRRPPSYPFNEVRSRGSPFRACPGHSRDASRRPQSPLLAMATPSPFSVCLTCTVNGASSMGSRTASLQGLACSRLGLVARDSHPHPRRDLALLGFASAGTLPFRASDLRGRSSDLIDLRVARSPRRRRNVCGRWDVRSNPLHFRMRARFRSSAPCASRCQRAHGSWLVSRWRLPVPSRLIVLVPPAPGWSGVGPTTEPPPPRPPKTLGLGAIPVKRPRVVLTTRGSRVRARRARPTARQRCGDRPTVTS